MTSPVVLTIAGSDSSGGAGVQADQRVIEALGCASVSVATALTSQNTQGVDSVFPVPVETLRSQLDSLLSDIRPSAVKIGLLPSVQHMVLVTEIIRKYDLGKIVLDPVIAPTAGRMFLDFQAIQELISILVPLCRLITPNLNEAFILSGVSISAKSDMERAAGVLLSRGAQAVLIKGGHLESEPTDLLATKSGSLWLDGERIVTADTHGTGCFLSSAIASYLALGDRLEDAAHNSKQLITDALKNPVNIGHGRGYPGRNMHSIKQHLDDMAKHRERQSRLRGIYFVTDHRAESPEMLRETVQSALNAGVKVIQLRDKTSPTDQLIELARQLRNDTHAHDALLIINDRVDIALASDADGVHLGPGDMHSRDARSILGAGSLIGISASSPDDASDVSEWASYIGCGAVYGSKTKGDAGSAIGVEMLREMHRVFPGLPIIAIGGIDLTNLASVRETGVAGAAVVSAISQSVDLKSASSRLLEIWQDVSTSAT